MHGGIFVNKLSKFTFDQRGSDVKIKNYV